MIQIKALRTDPGIWSELKCWLLTLIFNIVKLNSAYSTTDEEGSHNQEDMTEQRKIKFTQWYKDP